MKKLFPLITTMVACIPGVSFATVLVHQTEWTSETRMQTNLPQNSAWLRSGGAFSITPDNKLGLTMSGGNKAWGTTFAPDAPVALTNVGDKLSVQMKFTLQDINAIGTANPEIRIGLYNLSSSAGGIYSESLPDNSIAHTGSVTDNNGAIGATGYMAGVNIASSYPADVTLLELKSRTNPTAGNLIGNISNNTILNTIKTGVDPQSGFILDSEYTLEFSMELVDTEQVLVSFSFTGATIEEGILNISGSSVATGAAAYTSADSFMFRTNLSGGGSGINAMTINEFSADFTAVPEPSHYAILMGLFITGFVIVRRRL